MDGGGNSTVEGSVDVVVGRDVLGVPDAVWAVAVHRAAVIGALASSGRLGAAAVDGAAEELGLSRRGVYGLVRRWRAGTGVASDLIPGRSAGGVGRGRLAPAVDGVIADVIRRQYLTPQKCSVAAVCREVARVCANRGLPAPSRGAIDRRIAQVDPVLRVRKREGASAARALRSAGGDPPVVLGPLDRVQIDHTVVDLVVVDEVNRLPIGRPFVTVGIDVFSRAIPGAVLTLEAPSALSVGLCLGNMVTDKRAYLERLGVDVEWPMAGKPRLLYVDNATEFKSEALTRGCEQHGIALDYRPGGQPHYGGVVERVIGTLMRQVHELPGTTFSNPAQRGSYDSDARAALTLRELERWLALAIGVYHGSVHGALGQTPAALWASGVAARGDPPVVANEVAFLVDFLPVFRRTLTRTGFVIDHVGYFSDALKPWIARRGGLDRFVIRRDPRDISRVWVLDPEGSCYLEVPYRTLAHPPVSAWEQRAAVSRLRELGREQVDEAVLFAMIAQMRQIAGDAAATTRRARRDVARRPMANHPAERPPEPVPDAPAEPEAPAAVFNDIETW